MDNIADIGLRIAELVNRLRLLKDRFNVTFVASRTEKQNLNVTFFINEGKARADALFYSDQTGGLRGASAQNVSSDIGYRTGTFLFHLLLLLVIYSGTPELTLDNFTEDPARAADGIYSLLSVNTRESDTGKPASEFTRESIATVLKVDPAGISEAELLRERLLLSYGEMIYERTRDSFDNWAIKMSELSATLISGPASPWNSEAVANMVQFIRNLRASFTSGGGKKRSRHFSKKRTRKIKKKNTRKRRKEAKTNTDSSVWGKNKKLENFWRKLASQDKVILVYNNGKIVHHATPKTQPAKQKKYIELENNKDIKAIITAVPSSDTYEALYKRVKGKKPDEIIKNYRKYLTNYGKGDKSWYL